jgi:hypothetical protein
MSSTCPIVPQIRSWQSHVYLSITHTAYLHQPQGQTALVSGFNYMSRIFTLLGEVLMRVRIDKRSPPQGHFVTTRLEEVRTLHSRLITCLHHAPEAFRLYPPSRLLSEHGLSGFRRATFAEVKDFFDNPNASRENASNAFLVMQANILITQVGVPNQLYLLPTSCLTASRQQLVRFVIEQYRDELLASLQGGLNGHHVSEDRDAVASDLLNILHKSAGSFVIPNNESHNNRFSIPIQSIATNGPSLVSVSYDFCGCGY